MANVGLAGNRIRDRRLALRMKQVDLAKSCGISASYLNLIEHNRRRISGALLLRIAETLSVEVAAFDQDGDAVLVEQLRQSIGDNDAVGAEDFVGQYPEWATRLVAQSRRIEELERTLMGLDDRLTHDPVLSEKMHEVLGAVAAIRSTSSILVETPELDADWRARFHTNIDNDSRRLAETSAEMAAHFDRLTFDDTGFATPAEAISAFFEARGFHLPEIETGGCEAIEGILAQAPEFSGSGAKALGRVVLAEYASDAANLPLDRFSEAAGQHEYDPAALAQQFGVELPAVFRRLATLPRQPDRPEIGLVSCDAAGAILLRKPPTSFALPRFGAACPLWPVFAALRSPGTPLRQRVESPQGARFVAYAIAATIGPNRFDEAPVLRSFMVLVEDHLGSEGALTIGTSCRVCTVKKCRARREPSILAQDI